VVKYPHSVEERSGGGKLSSAFSSTGASAKTEEREWVETSFWEGKLVRSTRTPRRPVWGQVFNREECEWVETSFWEGKLERSTRTPRRPEWELGFDEI
jgi:hypothetical protein